jgi:methylaspartate mutase epsilon subunit
MMNHTILLGGIGGDSHSVGLTILREALEMNGYRVLYLGTQNPLEEFFRLAFLANVVMISDMDGHAKHYLREFPERRHTGQYSHILWYLGGNLVLGNADNYEKYFLELGFNRVFVKFVDIETVLSVLEADLSVVQPTRDDSSLWEQLRPSHSNLQAMVSDVVLESELFQIQRAQVLESWKTGFAARNIESNAEFLVRQPSFPRIQQSVNACRRPILIQPRSGVATVDQQIKLFQAFKRQGVYVLSYQIDSFTRNNDYAGAEEEIFESQRSGYSTMNGYPLINHGVSSLRRIISEVQVPLQTRHSTRDPRLLAEISYAGGITAFEGGAICYNIPYYRDYPLAQAIRNWQYVDCLTGQYYKKFGIVLDREFFGVLTGTLIPPSIAIVSNILEAILAVNQGVKCISLGYAEQGHRPQDIAAIRSMKQMTAKIIYGLGYHDVQINTVFHQYMAAFPQDIRRAEELITQSAITAVLSGATRVLTKSPVEAFTIPTLAENLRGLDLVMRGVEQAARIQVDESRVAEECDIIEREVNAIFDSVVLCGEGNISQAVVTAFKKGYLDVPFAPSIHNQGRVITARDTEGAVRFLRTGNLQLGRELCEYHRDKMQQKRHAESSTTEKKDYILVEKDVLRIARCQYEQWPLFG